MSAAGHYQLGVDLGTTWTAAAVARHGQVRMVELGTHAAAIPSVVHRAYDGTTVTGDAADRRGPTEPLRVAREFKRRLGDPTPVLLGGTPYSAEALLGTLLDAVVRKVAEREGGRPDHLTVTHPANWGPYKTDLFEQSVRMAGVPATTLTEPEAAAAAYAANERVQRGALIAVYDLGGGTFDTAILRKTTDGFAIVGQPTGIERLGGVDFDEAVIGHVGATLGDVLDRIDPSDPATFKALTRLRRDCVAAKEALSSDTEVAIPVVLPDVQTEVRLTRGEFEAMIRPTLHATIDALRRTIAAAAVEPDEISTVLLVGGSSRIPAVAELVSDAFGRPVAIDAHPKHAVALGAARVAAVQTSAAATEHDASVRPFAAAVAAPEPTATASPAAVGHTSEGADDDTLDLSGAIPANAAGHAQTSHVGSDRDGAGEVPSARAGAAGPQHGHDAAEVAPQAAVDADPDWLRTARHTRGKRSPRRWMIAVAAFVVLSVLTVGAGAFMTSEPRSEAFGDTTTPPTPEPSADTITTAEAGADDTDRQRPSSDGAVQDDDAQAAAGQQEGGTGDAATDHDADTTAGDSTGGTANDRTADGGGARQKADTPPADGTTPAPDAATDPPSAGSGSDPQPDKPADGDGAAGPSEPAGGDGDDGDTQTDPQPEPDPGPSAGADVSQDTPGASEPPAGTSAPATQA